VTWRPIFDAAVADWRSTLITTAQLLVAVVASVALLGMVTLNPYLLLGFSAVQGLLFLAMACYGAVTASRTSCRVCHAAQTQLPARARSGAAGDLLRALARMTTVAAK